MNRIDEYAEYGIYMSESVLTMMPYVGQASQKDDKTPEQAIERRFRQHLYDTNRKAGSPGHHTRFREHIREVIGPKPKMADYKNRFVWEMVETVKIKEPYDADIAETRWINKLDSHNDGYNKDSKGKTKKRQKGDVVAIYAIQDTVTKKYYVGQAVLKKRKPLYEHAIDRFVHGHIKSSRDKSCPQKYNRKFSKGIRGELGNDDFTNEQFFMVFPVKIVATTNDKKEADRLEEYFIKKHNSFHNGYNGTETGQWGDRTQWVKRELSEEHCKNLSKALKGRVKSAEERANMSAAQKGSKSWRWNHGASNDKIRQMRLDGISLENIAKEVGLSDSAVAGRLKEMGISVEPCYQRGADHYAYKDVDKEVVRQMHSEGVSLEKIGQHFGVSWSVMNRCMKEMGLTATPWRPKGKANPRYRDDIDDEEIKKLYLGGMNRSNIAKKIGVSIPTVDSRLRNNGVKVISRIRTDIDNNEIMRLFSGGMTRKDIARHFGMSPAGIQNRLKVMGVPTVPKKRDDIDTNEIKRLREAGLKHREIADKLGISEAFVQRRLKAVGIATTKEMGVSVPTVKRRMNEA